MSGLYLRLLELGLESLELRGIRADLVFACNIIFVLAGVNAEDIFTVGASNTLRGHGYKLHRVAKKNGTVFWYALTSSNIHRFSKLFHYRN